MAWLRRFLSSGGVNEIQTCSTSRRVFDRHDHVSPKDHERMRRAVAGSMNYNLAINSPLPSRDAILKNKHNKRHLSRVLSTFDMGAAVTIETQYTGVFGNEEVDVTIISYVLIGSRRGKECGACALRRY